jgi:hypothetical protein
VEALSVKASHNRFERLASGKPNEVLAASKAVDAIPIERCD